MENTWLGPMETLPMKRRDISIMCSKQGENREHSFLSIAVMRKCGCSEPEEQPVDQPVAQPEEQPRSCFLP